MGFKIRTDPRILVLERISTSGLRGLLPYPRWILSLVLLLSVDVTATEVGRPGDPGLLDRTHKKNKQESRTKITPWISYVCDIYFVCFFSLWVSFFCRMAQKKHHVAYIRSVVFCCLWHFDTWKVSAHLLFTWSKLTDADDVLGSWVTLNLSPREAVFDASALRIIRSSIRWNQRNFLGMKFRLPDDRSNF